MMGAFKMNPVFLLAFFFLEAFGGVVDITLPEQNQGIGEANQTCTQLIEKEQNTKNDSFCERVWDTISCWPPTPPGSLATIPCPSYLNGFNTAAFAHKYCTGNGTWFYHPVLNLTWTDYTDCPYTSIMEDIPELIKKHMPYIRLVFNIGYGISLVSLVLATTLMIAFRRLRCPRNTVHINLFISFILRASISFMKENLLVNSAAFASDVKEVNGKLQFIMEGTHWQCKLFFTVFHYILATNYIWILVEGLYLNMLITVAVFSEKSGIKWFILFGWASPIVFVGPWVIVRAIYENTLCWNTHNNSGYFWIMRGPIVLSVAVNFIIFLNTIRVLYTKLTAFNSFETKKFRYRRLAKSTMVLIPLFGVHYIVFIGLPDNVSKEAELVKLYFEMFFNSIQGFVVALLFCFLNGDVQTEIAKTWKRFRLSHGGELIRSHRDTVTSYVSRGRGSIVSSSNSETERKTSNHELKPLTRIQNDANENHKTNGHVQWQDESSPMIDYQSDNCVENHRPND
ncbi:secretin receptor-like isoform X2 [Mytilus galloprovincialis]|uniref:secretin receptor-like isoform X2 n=1 Tax=Mytilus galloprovincialis TaxID=29158 RepID=UPI003F7B8D40